MRDPADDMNELPMVLLGYSGAGLTEAPPLAIEAVADTDVDVQVWSHARHNRRVLGAIRFAVSGSKEGHS